MKNQLHPWDFCKAMIRNVGENESQEDLNRYRNDEDDCVAFQGSDTFYSSSGWVLLEGALF